MSSKFLPSFPPTRRFLPYFKMFFPFCIFPWCLPPPFPCYAINPKCLLANLSRVQFHPWREEERGGPSHQLVPLFILFRLGVSSWQQNRPIYFMAISSALTLSPHSRDVPLFFMCFQWKRVVIVCLSVFHSISDLFGGFVFQFEICVGTQISTCRFVFWGCEGSFYD